MAHSVHRKHRHYHSRARMKATVQHQGQRNTWSAYEMVPRATPATKTLLSPSPTPLATLTSSTASPPSTLLALKIPTTKHHRARPHTAAHHAARRPSQHLRPTFNLARPASPPHAPRHPPPGHRPHHSSNLDPPRLPCSPPRHHNKGKIYSRSIHTCPHAVPAAINTRLRVAAQPVQASARATAQVRGA